MRVLINCDMGEGLGNDNQLMPYIQAANIACGYHAGDISTMQRTIAACLQYGVRIGAHPSFHDREHFGRMEQQLEERELYDLISQQLFLFGEVAAACGGTMLHVKPHGALYNLSARDPHTASIIAKAVKDFKAELVLYGLSGSHSIIEAERIGLATANEVFADRSYQDDGSLTPRSHPLALLTDPEMVVAQVRQLVNENEVTTLSGKTIPCKADTICIHGDGPNALALARAIHQSFCHE